MRPELVCCCALAGCSFGAPSTAPGAPTDAAPGPDAAPDAGPDARPPVDIPRCSLRTDARLCLELDDVLTDGAATDSSPGAHHASAAEATRVTRRRGGVDQYVAELGSGSRILVPETDHLDTLEAFTVSLWFHATNQQAGGQGRQVLIDNNNQWSVSYSALGVVNATLVGETLVQAAAVSAGAWHHVALTFAPGDDDGVRLYLDGDVVACGSRAEAIGDLGGDGTGIGFNAGAGPPESLRGFIDAVHVYASALGADDVCADAGLTGCDDDCP